MLKFIITFLQIVVEAIRYIQQDMEYQIAIITITIPQEQIWLTLGGTSQTVRLKVLHNQFNQHSLSVIPLFKSETDLHVKETTLNNAGLPLPVITRDIDGEPRSINNPDIGADEFNPFQTDAGIYKIISPKNPFPKGENNIIICLKNFGSDTLKRFISTGV
jgi:hypothetical protein